MKNAVNMKKYHNSIIRSEATPARIIIDNILI
jgi:hypothetical protein